MFKFEALVIDIESELRFALKRLDIEGVRTLFLIEKGKLVGSITNGDIRRGLALGETNKSNLRNFANMNPVFLTEKSSPEEIYRSFSSGVELVPVLNEENEIVDIISSADKSTIPISEPSIGALEIELVNKVLKSNWISSTGTFVNEFENNFSEYIGSTNALSVCNGTQAIVLALIALGVGVGDEVIVPSLTFGATANAVLQIGATPVFIDIEIVSLGLDPNLLENVISDKTKAIIVVHLYGKPSHLTEIFNFAKKRNLMVIEDCAEALGTTYGTSHVGIHSDAGTFSFFANKTITTGEGGMVTFRDEETYQKAKLIRSHGFDPQNRYWHLTWGSNFRLTNIQAAIGVAQLERIDEFVKKKKEIASSYEAIFLSLAIGEIINEQAITWGTSSHWLNTVQFSNDVVIQDLVEYLASKRIETRRIFHPLPHQPAFRTISEENLTYPNSDLVFSRGLCLPSSTSITEPQIRRVINEVANFIRARE